MQKKKYDGSIRLSASQKRTCACIFGSLSGLINGLFGGGGGMIVVPVLTLLLGVLPKRAHATAILIILPMSIISGLFYSALKSLDLNLTLPVVIGVTLGGAVGALLLSKLSTKIIVIVFSLVMALAGIKMLIF